MEKVSEGKDERFRGKGSDGAKKKKKEQSVVTSDGHRPKKAVQFGVFSGPWTKP